MLQFCIFKLESKINDKFMKYFQYFIILIFCCKNYHTFFQNFIQKLTKPLMKKNKSTYIRSCGKLVMLFLQGLRLLVVLPDLHVVGAEYLAVRVDPVKHLKA